MVQPYLNASTLQLCYLILSIIIAYLSVYQYISIQNNYTFASIPLTLMIVFVSIVFGRITVYSENLIKNYKSDVSYEEEEGDEELNDVVPNPEKLAETDSSRANTGTVKYQYADHPLEGGQSTSMILDGTPTQQTDTDLNTSQLSEDDDTAVVKDTLTRLIDQLPYDSK